MEFWKQYVSWIPKKIWNHTIVSRYYGDEKEFGIIAVKDRHERYNFLWCAEQFNQPGKSPTYLVLLWDEDWSDILAPAPYDARHAFAVDRMRIIRFRIHWVWYGCRLPKWKGRPKFFQFRWVPEIWRLLLVHPFCSGGYAIVAIIHWKTGRIFYGLCNPKGEIIPGSIRYFIFPHNRRFGKKARIVGDGYLTAMFSIQNETFTLESRQDKTEKEKSRILDWMRTFAESTQDWLQVLPQPDGTWDAEARETIIRVVRWDIPAPSTYEIRPIQNENTGRNPESSAAPTNVPSEIIQKPTPAAPVIALPAPTNGVTNQIREADNPERERYGTEEPNTKNLARIEEYKNPTITNHHTPWNSTL